MFRQFDIFRRLLTAIALLFCAIGPLFAQHPPLMELNLAGDNLPQEAGESEDAGDLGEFKISLDSQLLTPRVEQTVAERFQLPEAHSQPFTGELVLRSSSLEEDTSAFDTPIRRIRESRKTDPKDFTTTLTLTTGYTHNHESESSRIMAGHKLGRLSLYGEFEKDTVSKVFVKPSSVRPSVEPVLLANSLARISTAGTAEKSADAALTKPLDTYAATENVSALALKNYYLEAIYNFMPSLQGKVSYKRSEIETLAPNENVQVEGIVEAGRDVIIKAGYRNETTPTDTKDHKPSGDKKVWTEFILKF